MRLRLASDLGGAAGDPFEQQAPLDEFFRVGIDVDRAFPPLENLDPLDQVGMSSMSRSRSLPSTSAASASSLSGRSSRSAARSPYRT